MKKILSFSLFPFFLISHPTSPEIISGSARFALEGSHLTVETTDKAIIEWKDFSIGSDECTHFLQPSAHSTVLNRVVSEIPSSLLGRLEANGQVLLINPNGILIGKNCHIETGQFIASTMNVSDEAFLGGEELLFAADRMAKIEHFGKITARDGDIFLLAPQVDHSGSDSAKTETIAAGWEILFRPKGEERIAIAAPMPSGEIENGYALAINLGETSLIECSEAVFLKAEEIYANGSISVPGGEVQILAKELDVGETASISVSSLQNGDGGRVILWADGKTGFRGWIEAKGGLEGGDGGFIEVSGRENLFFEGKISTLAPHGKTGMLLLDPTDFLIDAIGPDAGHTGGPVFSGTAPSAVLLNTTLMTALNGSNVTITTASLSIAPSGGIIDIVADVDNLTGPMWTAATSLTLIANNLINIKANVANPASIGIFCTALNDITIGDGGGVINAALDTGGAFPIVVTSTAGQVILKGGNSATSNALINGSTVDVTAATNIYVLGGLAGGSNATIQGTSTMNVTAQTGFIQLSGSTGGAANARIRNLTPGVPLNISALAGNIELLGGNSGSSAAEIICDADLSLFAGGNLILTGGAGGGPCQANISMAGSGTDIITVGGSATMTGGSGGGFVPALINKSGSSTLSMTVGGNMTQMGDGSSGGTSHANILGSLAGGTINLSVGGNYLMQGFGSTRNAAIEGMNSPINIAVGLNHTMNDAEISSTTSIFDGVGRNFTMFSSGQACRVESTGADIYITAGDNVVLTGVDPSALSPRIVPFTQADVIAGNNFILNDFSHIFSSNAAGAILNLVCDNDFPTPPNLGLGFFQAAATVTLGNRLIFGLVLGDFLRIFTSQRALNSISCSLNGDTYMQGPFLIDGLHERWCIWYFDPYYLANHVIFYKECEQILVALAPNQDFSDMFRDLRPFNEYIYLATQFVVFYDGEGRQIIKGATDTYDLYTDDDFFIRRRSYLFNNISNQLSPTAYEVSKREPLFE